MEIILGIIGWVLRGIFAFVVEFVLGGLIDIIKSIFSRNRKEEKRCP